MEGKDAPQVSEKKKKQKISEKEHCSYVSADQPLQNSVGDLSLNLNEFTPQIDTSTLEEAEKCSSKRNRRKKNKKKLVQDNVCKEHEYQEDGSYPPHTAIASISASFIPAVQEALRLLESNEEQMNRPKPSVSCESSSKPSKKSKKKNKLVVNEVEKIVTSGAKQLAAEKSVLAASIDKGGGAIASSSHIKSPVECSLNSKELELVFCASSIGPIYSRSSFSSTVAVSCSSSSSQLSAERVQNSHLFGNTPHSAPSEISIASTSPSHTMNPPAVQKSREEVEAERKARKAAKQAAKGKSKENIPAPVPAPKVKGKENAPTASPQAANLKEPTPENKSDKSDKNVAKDDEKSKAEMRAQRRAKQEAQRAAKAQQQEKQKAPQQPKVTPTSVKPKGSNVVEKVKLSADSRVSKEVKDTKTERPVKLFSHLYQKPYKNISQSIRVNHPQYHLAIVRLGVQYANRVVLGSNARCLALLYSLKELIADYETPPQKEFSRGLEAYLQPNMDFLQKCRPHSVSMINALRHIKWQLTQLPIDKSDAVARHQLQDAIDQYINEQIGKAAEAIGKAVSNKIADDDVILVYACSSLVLSALKVALDEKRKFRVIVVDSLPWLEGREMLRRLVSMGVQCSYVHLSAASFVMREVSKVLLGAHALLANGYVMSRAGSSQVALLAHTYNVPVLVCCETHKFSERVQTDSFVYNELGDPDELIGSRRAGEREAERERPLTNWRDLPFLNLLNLVYDVTPPDLVTAVVTERAILPCTSVPVILRIKPPEC